MSMKSMKFFAIYLLSFLTFILIELLKNVARGQWGT